MKKIEFIFGVRPEMEPFLEKVIDENRAQFREFGIDINDRQVIDMILYEALRKECEKFGFQG